MRSHQKSAVLLTTDQQFTSTHSIFDSFVPNPINLFSKSIDIIEVKSNWLTGLAGLHLFSFPVTTVFIFLCILTPPLDL